MKQFIYTTLFFLTLTASASSQQLWQIKGAEQKKASYIFVTHSLIPIQYLDSIPELYKAFGQCDAVISPMVLSSVDDMGKIQKAALLPQKMTVADLLNLNDYTAVDNELKSLLKVGLSDLGRLHPLMILSLYKAELYKQQNGLDEGSESESYFQLIAAQQDKKVIGLEDSDKQIDYLFGQTSSQQGAKLLVDAILHKDSTIARMDREVKLYKSGNIDALYDVIRRKEAERFPSIEVYDEQLKQRNILWEQQLLEFIKAAPCFIAVGAEHLPGRFGLFNMLRENGYSVKPIK